MIVKNLVTFLRRITVPTIIFVNSTLAVARADKISKMYQKKQEMDNRISKMCGYPDTQFRTARNNNLILIPSYISISGSEKNQKNFS